MLVNRLKLGYNLWKICSLVISVIIRQTWDQNIRLSCFPFLINFITADCLQYEGKTKPLISRIFLKAIILEDLFGPKKMKMNEIKVLIVLRAAFWDIYIYWAILKKSFVWNCCLEVSRPRREPRNFLVNVFSGGLGVTSMRLEAIPHKQ